MMMTIVTMMIVEMLMTGDDIDLYNTCLPAR